MIAKKNLLMVVVTAVVLILVVTAPTVVFSKSYIMTGKISAIDEFAKTVVIEVPLASKMFTVAGPLAEDAKLSKNNQMASLSDFMVGESVSVKWHSTPEGHVIDRLVSK
jgi:hypothetical protein